MKLLKSDLLPALNALMPIAGKRTTIPILNCVKMEAGGGRLSLRGSNIDCDLTVFVDCRATFPATCVPARSLHSVIESAEESVTIESEDKNRVRVDSGGTARIACLDAAEFIAAPDKSGTAIGVNPQDLSRAIKTVTWAACTGVASSNGRLVNDLDFVWVSISEKEIITVGTDRRTFAFCQIPAIGAPCEFRVPSTHATIFANALMIPDAQLFVGEKNAAVKHGGGELYVTLPSTTVPDPRVGLAVPRNPIGKAQTAQMVAVFSTCCALCADEYAPTFLRFSKAGVEVDFNGGANGYKTTIAGAFRPFNAKVDALRVIKALKAFDADELTVSEWDQGLSIEAGEMIVGIGLLRQ